MFWNHKPRTGGARRRRCSQNRKASEAAEQVFNEHVSPVSRMPLVKVLPDTFEHLPTIHYA